MLKTSFSSLTVFFYNTRVQRSLTMTGWGREEREKKKSNKIGKQTNLSFSIFSDFNLLRRITETARCAR